MYMLLGMNASMHICVYVYVLQGLCAPFISIGLYVCFCVLEGDITGIRKNRRQIFLKQLHAPRQY